MNKQWKILPPAPEDFFEDFPEYDPRLLQVLYNRGIRKGKDIDSFLHAEYEQGVHDPFLFKDMQKSVERVVRAMEQGERITIYGDYDADGITGSTIGATTFGILGLQEGRDFTVYLPDRAKEGYGLNIPALEELYRQGTRLMITVDCGITSINEVKHAQELGIDMIITDHHSIPEVLPEAYAIMNPRLPQEIYPCKFLCGVGTMYKFMQALLRFCEAQKKVSLNFHREGAEKWMLDIVAIGTVADMVPLLDENRIFVKYGLMVLGKTRRKGLQQLLKVNGSGNGSGKLRKINTTTIGFQIVPRINASGRLDHSSISYRLLMSDDAEEVKNLAKSLEQSNTTRKKIVDDIVREAEEQIHVFPSEDKVILVAGEAWPTGVLGLVASRIMQKHHRPALVISRCNGKTLGSGRSVPALDLIATLRSLPREWFENLGGHPMACGFTLSENLSFEVFSEGVKGSINQKISETDLLPELEIDAALDLHALDWKFMEQLEMLEPYGKDNPEPLFIFRNVCVQDIRCVGSGEQHIRLRLSQDQDGQQKVLTAIGFGLGKERAEFSIGDRRDVCAFVEVNEWNGNREIQLRLIDFRMPEI